MASRRIAGLALVILLMGALLVLFQTDSGSAILVSTLTSDTAQPLNTATVVQSKTSGCSFAGGVSSTCAFTSNVVSGNLLVVSEGTKGGLTTIQSKSSACSYSSGTSHTCAFTSNVVKGNLLIVESGVRTSTVNNVTDSLSPHTPFFLLGSCGLNTAQGCIYYGKAAASGADTVTVTTAGSAAGNIYLIEASGVTSSGATSNVGTGSCSANVQATLTTASTSFSNAALLVGVYSINTGTLSGIAATGAQWTLQSSGSGTFSEFSSALGTAPVTSPTTFSMTATSNANCVWAGEGGVFPEDSATQNTPTDSEGNTYTLLGCGSNAAVSCIYSATAGSSAADTVTVTQGDSTSGSVFLFELSGVTTTGATSKTATGTCGSNPYTFSAASTAFSNSPFLLSIVTGNANPGSNLTPETGYTAATFAQGTQAEYAVAGVATPTTFSMTSSSTVQCSQWSLSGGIFPQTPSSSYASTGLSLALVANTNYVFTAQITATTSASSSLNFEIHAFVGGATLVIANGNCAAGTSSASGSTASTATPILSTAPTGTPEVCTISGRITVGATGDTLQIDFVNPAAVGATVIKTGSFMQAQPGV